MFMGTNRWLSSRFKWFYFFLARVLVGKTTGGNKSTRICPPGFDTTGGGAVFVTYHDAQAYGEYLITFS
jgi:hypothetical protein